MIGHDFPYLDTRDLNLDWLLKNMKTIIKQWADYQDYMNQQFSDLEAAFNTLKNWIDSYFDNLDVQQEIDNKLDAMKASGELGEIMQPIISDETAAWLAAHITQPTTPVIDSSLTVEGAAADAKAAGNRLTNLKDWLDGRTLINDFDRVPAVIESKVISRTLQPHATTGFHIAIPVTAGDSLLVSGFIFDTTSFPLIVTAYNNAPVGTAGPSSTGAVNNYTFVVPGGVDTVYVNGSTNLDQSGCPIAYKRTDIHDQINDMKEEIRVDVGLRFDKTTPTQTGVMSKRLVLNSGIGKHYVVPVTPGDILLISGFEYDNGYPLAIYAKNGSTLNKYVEVRTGKLHNIETIVPDEANQIYINTNGSPDPTDGGALALLVYKQSIQDFVQKPVKWDSVNLVLQPGNINTNGSVQNVRGIYTNISASAGDILRINTYETAYPTIITYNGTSIIDRVTITGTNWHWIDNFLYEVPENATSITINGQNGINVDRMTVYEDYNDKDNSKSENHWNNKTGVWFGTSIPAAGYIGDNHISYPGFIGDILNMAITNEAVGSSCVHCKQPDRVSADNPYGFIGNFEAVSRCLTNTVAEMQWIIDHYNSDIWTSGTVTEMTETLANQIKSFSYQNKLDKYLTAAKEPFVFILDHGNNDAFNSIETENAYYAEYGEYSLYTFRGAMNFIIQRIKNFDPHANILLIGQYTGVTTDKIPAMQMQVADDWNLPICKLWERLGWTKTKSITCKGHWTSFYSGEYIWHDDPNESNTMTVFARWIPDGLHPHSDVSGDALRYMADSIAAWFETIK